MVGLSSAAFLSLPNAMDHVEGVEEGGRHRHGPVDTRRRFLRLSNITALPDRSIFSDVRARASLIRQPVSCRTVHSVRTGRSAVAAAAMKARRSSAVR